MKILLLVSALLFSSLILLSCKKNNPVPPEEQPQVSLSLEDVSCTEAWVKLSTSNIALPANVELLKDDSLNRTVNLTTADTVLYIDSLLPNQTYSFHTAIQPYKQGGKCTNFNYNNGQHLTQLHLADLDIRWAGGKLHTL